MYRVYDLIVTCSTVNVQTYRELYITGDVSSI